MARPTLIIAEPEPIEALSTRKLVLESAKFNVITAHDNGEALELFRSFPNIDAVVVVEARDIDCEKLAGELRKMNATIPLIALSPRIGAKCENVDHNISSHQPEELLNLVRSLLGDPRQAERRREAS